MILLEADRLAWFIRARRKRLGYTQEALAELAAVGRPWVVELEAGKKSAPPLDLVIRLLAALGCTLQVIDTLDARRGFPPDALPQEATVGQPAGKDGLQRTGQAKPHPSISRQPIVQERRQVESTMFLGDDYAITDFGAAGVAVDQRQLYSRDYREVLRSMVELVVVTEAPIFQDLLERRVAGAHGQRLTNKLKLVIASLTKGFHSTAEGDRKVIWASEPITLPSFRSDPMSLRDHADIPAVELEALAAAFLPGRTPDEVIGRMSERLGLSSVREATKTRLSQAVEGASRYHQDVES